MVLKPFSSPTSIYEVIEGEEGGGKKEKVGYGFHWRMHIRTDQGFLSRKSPYLGHYLCTFDFT